MSAKPRILSIQVFRGISAMLVVLLHLHNVERKYFQTHYMDPFQFGWIGVDLFFVISGVVISLVTAGKFQNRPAAVRFLYQRFARIYPTFWFYYAIISAAFLYNPLWINASSGHHADLLRSLFLIPSRYGNIVGQAWTLSYELNFYLVFFTLLLFVPERRLLWFLAAWGTGIISLDLLAPVPYDHWVGWMITNPFILEFLAGCLLFRICTQVQLGLRAGIVSLITGITWFGGLLLWTHWRHGGQSDWLKNGYWARPLACSVVGFLVLLGMILLERSGRLRVGKLLLGIGDWSYSIYLSHEVVIELIGRTAHRYLHNFHAAILVVDVVSVPLVIVTGYCGYTWVEKPLLSLLYGKRQGCQPRPGTRLNEQVLETN
jgi:exopolysaccharide production protein ExoZ